MHVRELKKSAFLKKEDCGGGIKVTISGVSQENVAGEGAPEDLKWCLHLTECEKPMVLNSTNGQIIAKIIGSEESDNWIGHKIVLYDDPNVSFGGKLVGGIRVRAPRHQAARPAAKPTPAPDPVAAPSAPCDANGVPISDKNGNNEDQLPF